MNKALILALLAGVAAVTIAGPAEAQKVKTNMLEKTRWHNAPREYQIIDDRPIIRDFREAPQEAGTIDLPPGPMAGGGGAGGGGGGALGGAPPSMPSGGLQLGGPNQGFRSAPAGLGSLPKSGFQGTNIPARGFAPKGLQNGSSTNRLMGKMMPQGNGAGAGAPRGMSPSTGRSAGNYTGPAVQSYSGGYGSGSGAATGGSASRTESSVRGSLLRSK